MSNLSLGKGVPLKILRITTADWFIKYGFHWIKEVMENEMLKYLAEKQRLDFIVEAKTSWKTKQITVSKNSQSKT